MCIDNNPLGTACQFRAVGDRRQNKYFGEKKKTKSQTHRDRGCYNDASDSDVLRCTTAIIIYWSKPG